MNENKLRDKETLNKFNPSRRDPHDPSPHIKAPETKLLERESNYTFRGQNLEGTRNTMDVLSNNFSMGNTERIGQVKGEVGELKGKGKGKYFMLDNMSFGKKSGKKLDFFTINTGLAFQKKEDLGAINLYSGKSQFSNSIKSSKSKVLRTLKTSEKSKKSKEGGSKRKHTPISEFSSGFQSKDSLKKMSLWSPSQRKKENLAPMQPIKLMKRYSQKLGKLGVGLNSSRKSMKNFQKTPKNCGKGKMKEFSSHTRNKIKGFSYSRDSEMFSSSKRNEAKGQRPIFTDKKKIIKAFEIGKKTPGSKLKKLSLDFSGKARGKNSQQTRKRLSIHVEAGEDDFYQLNRQYFSSRNSNIMEFKPFTAGKSSILKYRESNQASQADSKIKFSNFLLENSKMKQLGNIKTPTALFTKYLYKRKVARNDENKSERQNQVFKKKKLECQVMEIKNENNSKGLSIKNNSNSKLSSRKLASFFNKNNPKLKRKKLIANQKNQKSQNSYKKHIAKKNSLNNISKRLSNRKIKLKQNHIHESLNENSMVHIQNRVDIETLITSKLISSRTKNTFLDMTQNNQGKSTYNKSDNSIIFQKKFKNADFDDKKFKKSIMNKMRLVNIKKKQSKSKSKSKKQQKFDQKLSKKLKDEPWNLYRQNEDKRIHTQGEREPEKNTDQKRVKRSEDKLKTKRSGKKKSLKSKKIVLRKSSKMIISTRKSSKTPDAKAKSYTKKKKSQNFKLNKIGNSLGKKGSLKCKRNTKLFEQVKNKTKFFKTQLKNSIGLQERIKSSSIKKKQGLLTNKILLFKNIKEKLTSSFKQRQFKINLSSRVSNVKSIEKSKSLKQKQGKKIKFKSQKKISKLKLGSISPKNNLQSFRLRPYSKTPNSGSKVLKNLIKKWPKKRCKFKRNAKNIGVESVSCLEKSILDSKNMTKEGKQLILGTYITTPNTQKSANKLKIANLFSKHELQKKIQKNQKENFSKFNLSAIRESQGRKKKDSVPKQEKYKNLISIKFNLNKKKKEGQLKTPKGNKKIQFNAKIKKSGLKGSFKKLESISIPFESKNVANFLKFVILKKHHEIYKLKKYVKKKTYFMKVDGQKQKRKSKIKRKLLKKCRNSQLSEYTRLKNKLKNKGR
jgi:hypothetical protein